MFDVAWGHLALMVAIAIVAGVVRGFAGFGAGLIMVPPRRRRWPPAAPHGAV